MFCTFQSVLADLIRKWERSNTKYFESYDDARCATNTCSHKSPQWDWDYGSLNKWPDLILNALQFDASSTLANS